MDGSSDIECVVNDRSVVFMQFVLRYGSSRFSESMQFWFSLVAEWFRRQPNVRSGIVVLMQFLWSGGRVVEATEKSGTCRLMRAVLCSCSFLWSGGLLVVATDVLSG